jgi:glycosyltransferase involved in cell wall biosynthesis
VFLLAHDAVRARMSLAAEEYAKNYSWNNVASELLEVYEEVRKS